MMINSHHGTGQLISIGRASKHIVGVVELNSGDIHRIQITKISSPTLQIEVKACSIDKIAKILEKVGESHQKHKKPTENVVKHKKAEKDVDDDDDNDNNDEVIDDDPAYKPTKPRQKRKSSISQESTKKKSKFEENVETSKRKLKLAKELLSDDINAMAVLGVISSVIDVAANPTEVLGVCDSKIWEIMNMECETPEEHEQHEIAQHIKDQFPEKSSGEVNELAVKMYKKKHPSS